MKTVLAMAMVLWAAAPALADDISEAREHFRRGTRAYDLGHYEDAVKEYEAAYNLKDDPALLFNIAQAYRLAGDNQNAVRVYHSFLRKVPNSPMRAEVERRIDELQRAIDQQGRAKEGPPEGILAPSTEHAPAAVEPAHPPAAPVAPPPVASVPSTPVVVAPAPAPARDLSSRKKIAGIVVGSLGVAMLATGIGLSVAAQQAGNDLTALDQSHQPFDASKEQLGQSLDVAGPVLIGVGAAAVVAGAVVAIVGFREAKRMRAMSVVPASSPGRAVMKLGWEF